MAPKVKTAVPESWTLVVSQAPWDARRGHSVITVLFNVGEQYLWVIGGEASNSTRFNDVWSTHNGCTFSFLKYIF
jgi:hypothetical protein